MTIEMAGPVPSGSRAPSSPVEKWILNSALAHERVMDKRFFFRNAKWRRKFFVLSQLGKNVI